MSTLEKLYGESAVAYAKQTGEPLYRLEDEREGPWTRLDPDSEEVERLLEERPELLYAPITDD